LLFIDINYIRLFVTVRLTENIRLFTCRFYRKSFKKKQETHFLWFPAFLSVPEQIRTADLPLRRRTLYPAELRIHIIYLLQRIILYDRTGAVASIFPGITCDNRKKTCLLPVKYRFVLILFPDKILLPVSITELLIPDRLFCTVYEILC
jgi:hypothetical protein